MRRQSRSIGKGIVLALCLVLLTLAFPLHASAYLKGDVDGDGKISLTEAIHALQVVSESRTPLSSKIINVPGDIPTIQKAIDEAEEGDTISIAAGTYYESLLTIKKRGITLQGADRDTTIIDGGGQHVVVIEGASGVGVKELTIQNGRHGILIGPGAVCEVREATIQNCAERGIQVYQNSTALIADSKVLSSGNDGIFIFLSSSAIFRGVVESSNNGRDGFHFNSTSSGFFLESSNNSASFQ